VAAPRKDDAATVAKWLATPEDERGATAALGARMVAGEWTGPTEADALGVSHSMTTQAAKRLEAAGYRVERKRGLGSRVKAGRAKAASKAAPVRAEVAGVTHPPLGATLTVRALAFDAEGQLVMSLSNGTGAWTARITGHVGA
jgi:hypothetical protein